MSGIGLAYKTPEQQAASTLDAGARAVTQVPASPGIGLATVPQAPVPVPDVPAPQPTVTAPAAAAPAPVVATPPANAPLIDWHTNPLGAVGLVLSSAAAGINGTESPVEQLKKNQLEQQAQQYRTASLALDVVDKTSAFVSKLPASQRDAAIKDLDARFSPALGGHSIAGFLTAVTAGTAEKSAATLAALKELNPSPTMMAYFSANPSAAVDFLDKYNDHKASAETPAEAGAKASAVATAQNAAGANKPMTPAEIAANNVARQNAGTSAASLAETQRHNAVDEKASANKPLTTDQANAATFADRAHEAEKVLGPLAKTQTSAKGAVLNQVSGGNYLQSSDYQRADQAQRDFVNAVLRRESGAAIAPSEFDNAAKQYFPQPGDKQEVISQKARNRATAINGLERAAGSTYKVPAPVIQYDSKGNRL